MTIIEAIKSGRPFKRSSWNRDFIRPPFVNLNLPAEDLIADDWEVESTPVTITREQFDAAWRKAEDICENMEITTRHYLYELVVRELGL